MKKSHVTIHIILFLCAIFGATYAMAAPPAPTAKSIVYNTSYDFLQDTVLDDTEIVWSQVPEATGYKLCLLYSGPGYADEFVIPNESIIDFGTGDLKFIWTDYETNHPKSVPYLLIGISLKAVNIEGESNLSNIALLSPNKTVIYGRVTDGSTGANIAGGRISMTQYNSYTGQFIVNYPNRYTDTDGMYYIVSLPYELDPGTPGDTRIRAIKNGYQDSPIYQVILDHNGETERRDIIVMPQASAPTAKSIAYNTSCDFLQDAALDDVEVVWSSVAGAIGYKMCILFSYAGYADEFVIPNESIIDLGTGDLKFVWTDYETNHPNQLPYAILGVSLKTVTSESESAKSNIALLSPNKTVIYGRVTDRSAGANIAGVKISIKQYNSYTGQFIVNYPDRYTDADGIYYIVSLPYLLDPGAQGDTRMTFFKEGYSQTPEASAILSFNGQVERRDIYFDTGNIIIVNPGDSLQDAVNNAGPGYTVQVMNGEYEEDVEISGATDLILTGEDSAGTLIRGNIVLKNTNATIKNITIYYKDSGYIVYTDSYHDNFRIRNSAGITAINSSFTVEGCVIKPDDSVFGGNKFGEGIKIWNLYGSLNISPTIENNLILNTDTAIYLYSQAFGGAISGLIKNNTLDLNNYGIVMRTHKENPAIQNNILTRSQDAAYIAYDSLLTDRLANISNNCFGAGSFGNVYNIWCDALSGEKAVLPDARGNISEDPLYVDPSSLDYMPQNPDCADKGARL